MRAPSRRLVALVLLASVVLPGCPEPAEDEGEADAGTACPARTLGPAPKTARRGVLEVLAGEGGAGFADGPGGRTNGVGGFALVESADGPLVVLSDIFNGTLRGLDLDTGSLSTLVGVPFSLGSVDGVCAEVRMNGPRGIAADPAHPGVVWFGDGPCLRRTDVVTGDTRTIAGDCVSSGDADGPLRDARFSFLFHDVEVDPRDGLVYVADRGNDAIRVVDVEHDDVFTLARGLDGPGALALDSDAGQLYVADTFRCVVQRIDVLSGETVVVAGRPEACGAVDGPVATATLDDPQGMALVDRTLVLGGFDGLVRAVDLDTGVVDTIAEVPAGFFAPFLALEDDVLVADNDGGILRIARDGTVLTVSGARSPTGYVDGDGVDARFGLPTSVVVDADGTGVLVSDSFNHAIRRVDILTGATTTFLGGPAIPDADGPLARAGLDFPAGLARDAAGTVFFVAANGSGKVKRIDVASGTVTTLVEIEDPWEIALDEDDAALWVTSSFPGTVSRVDLSDHTVTQVAAGLSFPVGVAVVEDVVYVAENEAHVIVAVSADGTVTDVLGTRGFPGGVDGDASTALLFHPSSLHGAIEDGVPALYVAETGGQVVRRVDLRDFSSRFVAGSPVRSGALPAGARVALDEATLLNPQDVTTVGDDVVIVGDTTVVVARP